MTRRSAPITQKFFAIASMYARGETMELIAAEYGVTRQRVHIVARRAGLPLRFPQRRPVAAAARLDARLRAVAWEAY